MNLSDHVQLPGFEPAEHGVGIVHLGVGAFHRAHQAVYTDAALSAKGGDWRIIAVSLRSRKIVDALNSQNGRYTLLVKDPEKTSAREIASIARAIAASRDLSGVLKALTAPGICIVSLTVSEKAYGIQRTSGEVMLNDEVIAHDLAHPDAPKGPIGLIVEGLRLRRAAGIQPFTVLCCDNLPDNGTLIRSGVVDFARRLNKGLADWIAENVAFPSTMVDRITPAATDETFQLAQQVIGTVDLAAVETEPFSQWVIEDNFPTGRPAWEAGGAIFVRDVAPYESMKLRMLNGAHSLLAYAGFIAGLPYVRDAMAFDPLAQLVSLHMKAAALTLKPVAEIDLEIYQAELLTRFANPEIAHETYQIAMDGTEKLPQRLLMPAAEALGAGSDISSFAFAVAAWMRYCTGISENGDMYDLRDPREAEIRAALCATGANSAAIADALEGLPGLFPKDLLASSVWRGAVRQALGRMLEKGMRATIEQEIAC